jgi:hypothetical protein
MEERFAQCGAILNLLVWSSVFAGDPLFTRVIGRLREAVHAGLNSAAEQLLSIDSPALADYILILR